MIITVDLSPGTLARNYSSDVKSKKKKKIISCDT